MILEVITQSSVNEEEWNEQLCDSEFSSAYQTNNWIKNYQKLPGSIPVFIQVRTEKNKIVGQLASIIQKNYLRNENVLAKNLGSKFNISSILTWSYGPIIYDPTNYSKILSGILSELDKIAQKHKVIMIRGSTSPLDTNNSKKVFLKKGYRFQPWSTHLIKLDQDQDNLHSSFDKKTRYDIRKSEKNNLTFKMPEGPDYLKEFYELKNEEYQRDGRKIAPISKSYEERWKNLYKNGFEKVFLAKNHDHAISGISNIIFNGYLIQHGVANSLNRNLLSGTFLTWETIKWAIKNKQKYYDMGGVNPNPASSKEKNIDFFKSKWGGQKYSFGIYTKILDKKKQILSSILKNPKSVLRKLHHRKFKKIC